MVLLTSGGPDPRTPLASYAPGSGVCPRENFEIYVNACTCSAKPHDGVANSLEDSYKEQNRSHAKHESGLVTDVLWSLGLLVTTVSPAKADELIEMLFGVSGLKPAKHRGYILHGVHIGAAW